LDQQTSTSDKPIWPFVTITQSNNVDPYHPNLSKLIHDQFNQQPYQSILNQNICLFIFVLFRIPKRATSSRTKFPETHSWLIWINNYW
jgi:hypothetical protein